MARKREWKGAHTVLVGKSEGKKQLVRPGRRWEKILKWTFNKQDGGRGVIWFRTGTSEVSSEHSNEPSSSKTSKKFDQLNTGF